MTITLPDTTAPAVTVAAPANNATVSGLVLITANASDNVGVTNVSFYVNGNLAATSSGSQLSYSWDTTVLADGSYTLSARAYDAAGNIGQSSATVVTVSNSTPLTLSDAMLALQASVGRTNLTASQTRRLDVAPLTNGKSVPDGRIDSADVYVILTKVVGKSIL